MLQLLNADRCSGLHHGLRLMISLGEQSLLGLTVDPLVPSSSTLKTQYSHPPHFPDMDTVRLKDLFTVIKSIDYGAWIKILTSSTVNHHITSHT